MPLEDVEPGRADRVRAMAEALAPSLGLDAEAAARAADHVDRALGLPVVDRARRATRVWRELSLWFPDGAHLVEGIVDLVFEEDGQLVVVDYKSDAIAEDQALAQAAGLPVRERLVLFTALGRAVPVQACYPVS
jgi:ATP-dependent exoDNAse (exonuclease V) beta subunit